MVAFGPSMCTKKLLLLTLRMDSDVTIIPKTGCAEVAANRGGG